MRFFCILLSMAIGLMAPAAPGPVLYYRLTVDAGDTTGYTVELRIDHVPRQFRLAMATHHEYDDRFWRYVQGFRVEVEGADAAFKAGGGATVRRSDSAVYAISVPGGAAVIRYRIRLPTHSFAHRPFLSSYGGLVGDIHSFFYVVGYEHVPATVKFVLPTGWRIATGLDPTADSTVWRASSVVRLMDCPVLVGRLRERRFEFSGVPYTVAYLPAGKGPGFDTTRLIDGLRKIVEQAVGLFRGAPYKHYTFQLIDGVYGALEHSNSVTIGAPAGWLADRMPESYAEIAHEFFHTWNLISIRPGPYTDLNYGPQERSPGLWWAEGVTMYYADQLLRRAGLPAEDSSRRAHLAAVIGRYYADTGNRVFGPERVSLASDAGPGQLGDYTASTHVQGELLGAMLDILIGHVTDGRRSLDDVMRLMYMRFGGKNGFLAQDLEKAAAEVCGSSDSVHVFFERYVYQGKPLEFDRYLRLIGLRLEVGWAPAADNGGHLLPDKRLYVWQPAGDTVLHLILTDPRSCWGLAGLHTGDALLTLNGESIRDRGHFYAVMNRLQIGDTVETGLRDKPRAQGAAVPGEKRVIRVGVSGYSQPLVRLQSR